MKTDPYLGQNCRTPYSKHDVLKRWLWLFIQSTLFRWSPRPFHGFRCFLLYLFGAKVSLGKVVVFPTAKIAMPWNLTLADRAMIGPHANLYSLGAIRLEYGANISQNVHLCAGTHDHMRWDMPLRTGSIVIGRNVWIAADVFIGPNVTIGELCVVGARSVVMCDLPPRKICVGNPCRPIKERLEPT
jgi:putative colanic acid biosynthesis acetyltransferase WcaF